MFKGAPDSKHRGRAVYATRWLGFVSKAGSVAGTLEGLPKDHMELQSILWTLGPSRLWILGPYFGWTWSSRFRTLDNRRHLAAVHPTLNMFQLNSLSHRTFSRCQHGPLSGQKQWIAELTVKTLESSLPRFSVLRAGDCAAIIFCNNEATVEKVPCGDLGKGWSQSAVLLRYGVVCLQLQIIPAASTAAWKCMCGSYGLV